MREQTCGWLGQFPKMREWLGGERVIRDLNGHNFMIVNRKFESTIDMKREDFDDDRPGVFKPIFAEMGHEARQHAQELINALLASGFTELGFDGQPFFYPDHPSIDKDGNAITVRNVDDGTGPAGTDTPGAAWFLLDRSRWIKPTVWQEREKCDVQTMKKRGDSRVFMTDQFLYGARARVNAGFGLWHMAYGSKAPLRVKNSIVARMSMMKLRGEQSRITGIMQGTPVVPPVLEDAELHIVNTEMKDGGGSNVYKGTAELIVTPYLAA